MPSSSGLPSPRPLPPLPRFTALAAAYLGGLFFLSRLLVLAVAATSHLVVEQGPFSGQARTWVDRFSVWDAGWYLVIARDGYDYRPGVESSVAFYPVYPMLLRAAHFLGLDTRLAGYAISHAALLAACVLLWKLAALETRSERVAERAVLFLLFCPGSMWFGMIYTESFFLLTLLGCLLCARQGRWIAAGLWGLVSALTRTPGLLLAGFLFLEGLQQWWEQRRAVAPAETPWPWRATLAAAGPVAGHVSYLAFLQIRFGDWRAQQKTMAAGWGGGMRPPWTALAQQWQYLERHLMVISTPLLAITLALALAGLFTLKRVGYAVLVVTLCILYVSATPGDSVTRYLATAAPVYIVLAQLSERSRLLETAALVFSVAMMVLLTILLINGYHII